MTWIGGHYEIFQRLAHRGVWMQVTAGSLTGRFGEGARHWGERMLDEGLVHILATDAHGTGNRAPRLSEGRNAAAKRVGEEEAQRLVNARPQAILDNTPPAAVTPIPALRGDARSQRTGGFWRRLVGSRRDA